MPRETLESFTFSWESALAECNITEFHAKDFFAHRGEFTKFSGREENTEEQARRLLVELLRILNQTSVCYVGTFVDLGAGDSTIRNEYRKCVIDLMRAMADRIVNNAEKGKIALVFADHSYYVQDIFNRYRAILDPAGSVFDAVNAGFPKENLSLQAADLVAYEMSRYARYEGRNRFPFAQMINNSVTLGPKVQWVHYSEPASAYSPEPSKSLKFSNFRD